MLNGAANFVSCEGMRILFFILISFPALWGQELAFKEKMPLDADRFIGYDTYKHLYTVKNGALYKQGVLGKFVFQDFQLGPITSVDLINPLNVVVFYSEVNTVVFLDNRLNEKERLNFNDLPSFLNISLASNAGNNRLWVFNFDTQQLQLFHYRNMQETIVSQPLRGKILSEVSNFNDCTLLTETNLRRINNYGSLLFDIPLEGFEKLVQHQEILLGLKENSIYQIQPESVKELRLDLVEKPIKDLQLTQEFLYIYDGKTLYSFTLTQPKK